MVSAGLVDRIAGGVAILRSVWLLDLEEAQTTWYGERARILQTSPGHVWLPKYSPSH